ncbi:MAG: hypothetical protein ACE15E_02245, partial [Acidobacteriota bacterium]
GRMNSKSACRFARRKLSGYAGKVDLLCRARGERSFSPGRFRALRPPVRKSLPWAPLPAPGS